MSKRYLQTPDSRKWVYRWAEQESDIDADAADLYPIEEQVEQNDLYVELGLALDQLEKAQARAGSANGTVEKDLSRVRRDLEDVLEQLVFEQADKARERLPVEEELIR